HVDFFRYIIEMLKERRADHISVFGGGGGVIVPSEIRLIESFGVSKIFSPEDGRKLGLRGMIDQILLRIDHPLDVQALLSAPLRLRSGDWPAIARLITAVEVARAHDHGLLERIRASLGSLPARTVPVLGVTGTGGAGKSSLVDELVLRFLHDFSDKSVAILSVDPTRRRSGGALLGDRIRMNAIDHPRVYMRSLATRSRGGEVSESLVDSIAVVKAAGFDWVIVETAGIGQGDAAIVPLVDVALYAMTAEFGAPTQLEKIDMLDFADLVAINKFERQGSDDALRHVRKQYQRNRSLLNVPPETMPVYGTIASRFNDDGMTALYLDVLNTLRKKCGVNWETYRNRLPGTASTAKSIIVPAKRMRYLAEIAETVRAYHRWADDQAAIAERLWRIDGALSLLEAESPAHAALLAKRQMLLGQIAPHSIATLEEYSRLCGEYAKDEFAYTVRGREIRTPLYGTSLSGIPVPRVALPHFRNPGELLRWLLRENLPGRFPYTAGVFPFKRMDEEPTRMFAGEGDAARTNARFKFLSKDSTAKRLSTAFDSVTLYGCDPAERPDIRGKVGTSGVSICSLENMKTLYDGFDLCAPTTSVSMTINGPAPIILAMFLNTAIDQQMEAFEQEQGRRPDAGEAAEIEAKALRTVRGTVQADILKEDQAQNTC
ncbi:MAG: methylmalonyl-CoA mutase family protein, partial [Candidatus Hydrogenedentales bacterium]